MQANRNSHACLWNSLTHSRHEDLGAFWIHCINIIFITTHAKNYNAHQHKSCSKHTSYLQTTLQERILRWERTEEERERRKEMRRETGREKLRKEIIIKIKNKIEIKITNYKGRWVKLYPKRWGEPSPQQRKNARTSHPRIQRQTTKDYTHGQRHVHED